MRAIRSSSQHGLTSARSPGKKNGLIQEPKQRVV
jgi:hypothetical protein